MNDTEMRRRMAEALMGANPSDVVVNRGNVLPLGDYADGTTRLAWPSWMHRMGQLLSMQERPDPTQGDALLLGGVPVMGSMPFAQRNALGSGGGRMSPEDFAARLKQFGQEMEAKGTPIKRTPAEAQALLDTELAALRQKFEADRVDPRRIALEEALRRAEEEAAKGKP